VELPPFQAEAAIIGPTSELVRRIEMYEADAVTPWKGGANDERLITGSVNIDYSRDERRSVDLTLDNTDFGLEHAPTGLWYDKIIKVFCGVRYVDTTPQLQTKVRTNYVLNPRVATAVSGWSANYSTTGAGTSGRITGAGVPNGNDTAFEVTWTTSATAVSGGAYYYQPAGTGGVAAGEPVSGSVYVRSSKKQRLRVLHYFYDTAGTNLSAGYSNETVVNANEWTLLKVENVIPPANATRMLIGAYAISGTDGSLWVVGDKFAITSAMIEKGEKVINNFTGATADFANRDYAWTGTPDLSISTETITYSTPKVTPKVWEVQVGEFMIDQISEEHFPFVASVNGRDYTKKCMLSKFSTATAFAEGTAIETAIKAMAQNAGITKFILPLTGHSLGKDYVYERGVARWEAMKDIANAFDYELFFNAEGYLVMREYLDPTSAPIVYTFATGPLEGNLVSYGKTVNDNRIYNKIVVTGEASDAEIIPVSAIATNTSPTSPTSIAKIGERVFQYTSAFITTTLQAQTVADSFLKIHALEEFDLNFAAIALPWLEVGEIIEFIDPRPAAGQPTRFLLSSLNLPLGLEAMSGNAKRVSVVG
jgi:hypothetical protein